MDSTSVSLLQRLRRPDDSAAWSRFVRLYTPLLYSWSRRLSLQPADAADLVQEIFVALVRKLPEFQYNPRQRFRGWLWNVALNKYRERWRRHAPVMVPLHSSEVPEPADPDPAEAMAEAEYWHYLVQHALRLLQAEFPPATWK